MDDIEPRKWLHLLTSFYYCRHRKPSQNAAGRDKAPQCVDESLEAQVAVTAALYFNTLPTLGR
jgi:hypothetical protein